MKMNKYRENYNLIFSNEKHNNEDTDSKDNFSLKIKPIKHMNVSKIRHSLTPRRKKIAEIAIKFMEDNHYGASALDIANKMNCSRAGILIELNRLYKLGLAEKHPDWSRKYYFTPANISKLRESRLYSSFEIIR